jgi:hypothetical protein
MIIKSSIRIGRIGIGVSPTIASLLLHMDGSNGSTTFTDNSLNALTVTPNVLAQISTAQSKFGGASGYFSYNGVSGSDSWLSIANNTNFEFGAGDFTIECWIRPDSISNAKAIISKGNTGTTNDTTWTLEFNGAEGLTFYGPPELTPLVETTTSFVPATWYHIAVTRESSTYRIFVNGVLEDSTTVSNEMLTGGPLIIGSGWFAPSDRGFYGYIDELRLAKGYAAYTSTFSPPTQPFVNP